MVRVEVRQRRAVLCTREYSIPRTFEAELDQWRTWKDDVADFFDTRNVGMVELLLAISKSRDKLADPAMKREWAMLVQGFKENKCRCGVR